MRKLSFLFVLMVFAALKGNAQKLASLGSVDKIVAHLDDDKATFEALLGDFKVMENSGNETVQYYTDMVLVTKTYAGGVSQVKIERFFDPEKITREELVKQLTDFGFVQQEPSKYAIPDDLNFEHAEKKLAAFLTKPYQLQLTIRKLP